MIDSDDEPFEDWAAKNNFKDKRDDDASLNGDTEEEEKTEDHSMKNRLSRDDASAEESVDKADKKVEDESTSSPDRRGKNDATLERQRKKNKEGKKRKKRSNWKKPSAKVSKKSNTEAASQVKKGICAASEVKKLLRLVRRQTPKRLFANRRPTRKVQTNLIATDQELWLYGRFGASKNQPTC